MPETTEKKELPLVIKTLRRLFKHPPSKKLSAYLDTFTHQPDIRQSTFIQGIIDFTKIANLTFKEREAYYGDALCGFHYSNDLATYWNEHYGEKTTSSMVGLLAPPCWDYQCVDGQLTLLYKGNQPAEALDALLQGPSVIDCGMFCQLAIYFGLKQMLGNQTFNQLFGFAPLYITQLLYNAITEVDKAYVGNPLFAFMDKLDHDSQQTSSLVIAHIPNHRDYSLKHLGGGYSGHNTLQLGTRVIGFDPSDPRASDSRVAHILESLFQAYNAPLTPHDIERRQKYQQSQLDNPHEIHPRYGLPYDAVLVLHQTYADRVLKRDEWEKGRDKASKLRYAFNFDKLAHWLHHRLYQQDKPTQYPYARPGELKIDRHQLKDIPWENRHNMSFEKYVVQSPLQRRVKNQALYFCQSVMQKTSRLLILSGLAGIGKTASAVCAYIELKHRGKNVLWFSEVQIRAWMQQADSMEALEKMRLDIRQQLSVDIDAIFLDDDNLVGTAGKVLLEEVYLWYSKNNGKGLLITSNEPVSLSHCYGLRLDKSYDFAPLAPYGTEPSENIVILGNLKGQSYRPQPAPQVMDYPDHIKLQRLGQLKKEAATVGIIVDEKSYASKKQSLPAIEEIPGFTDKHLAPIRRHLRRTTSGMHEIEYDTEAPSVSWRGGLTKKIKALFFKAKPRESHQTDKHINYGPHYETLTPLQKQWTHSYHVSEKQTRHSREPAHVGFNQITFDKTDKKIIAIEMISRYCTIDKCYQVSSYCIDQLLAALSFAFDSGNKQIILINKTPFSHQDLLAQIKKAVPNRERKRTYARLDAIFYSPQLLKDKPNKKPQRVIQPSKKSRRLDLLRKKANMPRSLFFKPHCSITITSTILSYDSLAGLYIAHKEDAMKLLSLYQQHQQQNKPLFIYNKTGLSDSELLQALLHALQEPTVSHLPLCA